MNKALALADSSQCNFVKKVHKWNEIPKSVRNAFDREVVEKTRHVFHSLPPIPSIKALAYVGEEVRFMFRCTNFLSLTSYQHWINQGFSCPPCLLAFFLVLVASIHNVPCTYIMRSTICLTFGHCYSLCCYPCFLCRT